MSRPDTPGYKTLNWPAYSAPLMRHWFEQRRIVHHWFKKRRIVRHWFKNNGARRAANALKRRGSLTIWFDPEMSWAANPTGKRGRQPVYSGEEDQKTVQWTVFLTNAVQTCLTMKVLFGMVDIVAPLVRATMSTRQTTGFVQSLLQRIGLDWAVPDFSTLSRRQKTLKVSYPGVGRWACCIS